MNKNEIRLCEGEGCPLKESCAFYCIGFDKSKTHHWGKAPYKHRKGQCDFYEKIDVDFKDLNQTQ